MPGGHAAGRVCEVDGAIYSPVCVRSHEGRRPYGRGTLGRWPAAHRAMQQSFLGGRAAQLMPPLLLRYRVQLRSRQVITLVNPSSLGLMPQQASFCGGAAPVAKITHNGWAYALVPRRAFLCCLPVPVIIVPLAAPPGPLRARGTLCCSNLLLPGPCQQVRAHNGRFMAAAGRLPA